MKYVPPVGPKSVPKLKMLILLKFSKFDISDMPMLIMMLKIIFMKICLLIVWHELVPKLKESRIYRNMYFIFQ